MADKVSPTFLPATLSHFWGALHQAVPHSLPQVVGAEEFTGVAGVVLLVEKCEESEVSELRSGVSNAASYRRGYVSSFSNFSGVGSDWAR
jgi:hypothetical protein